MITADTFIETARRHFSTSSLELLQERFSDFVLYLKGKEAEAITRDPHVTRRFLKEYFIGQGDRVNDLTPAERKEQVKDIKLQEADDINSHGIKIQAAYILELYPHQEDLALILRQLSHQVRSRQPVSFSL